MQGKGGKRAAAQGPQGRCGEEVVLLARMNLVSDGSGTKDGRDECDLIGRI